MWDLPGSGIEPVSPALAGGSFTTEPSGKPPMSLSTKPLRTDMWPYFFTTVHSTFQSLISSELWHLTGDECYLNSCFHFFNLQSLFSSVPLPTYLLNLHTGVPLIFFSRFTLPNKLFIYRLYYPLPGMDSESSISI